MTNIATAAIGKFFEGTSPSLMSRVVGSDAVALTQSDIASIAYTIWDLDDTAASVADGALDAANVVFDTLQTSDARWTADSDGYNFLWSAAGSLFPAFDAASKTFRVEIVLTDTGGGQVVLVFEPELKNLYSRAEA